MIPPKVIRVTFHIGEMRAVIKNPRVQFMPAVIKFTDQESRVGREYAYGRVQFKEKGGITTLRFERI